VSTCSVPGTPPLSSPDEQGSGGNGSTQRPEGEWRCKLDRSACVMVDMSPMSGVPQF